MSFSILSSNIALGNANVASHLVQVSNSALTLSRADAQPLQMTVLGNVIANASNIATLGVSGYSNIATLQITDVWATNANISGSLGIKTTPSHALDVVGNVRISNCLFMSNQISNNMICLYGDTVPTSTNVYGFGVNSSTLRYNSPSTHKWYANTTNTMSVDATGNFSAAQNVTAYASDERLKTNVTPIENALEKVRTIKGVSFEWDSTGPQPMRGRDVGLIAQDIARVLPEAVHPAPFDIDEHGNSRSGKDYLTIDFGNKIIALLVEAVKDLSEKVETLEKKLKI